VLVAILSATRVHSPSPGKTFEQGTYNPASSDLDISGVEYDVPHLAEKHISASELEIASVGVLIGLNQAQGAGAEVWCPLDDRHVGGIPDDLCVVIVYNGA
jgi:hypothetical protein